MPRDALRDIGFILLPRFSLAALGSALGVIEAVNDIVNDAPIRVTVVGNVGQPVKSATQISVIPASSIDDIGALDFLIAATIQSSQVDDNIRLTNDLLQTARVSENGSINLNNLYFRSGMTMHSQMPTKKAPHTGDGNRRHEERLTVLSAIERVTEKIITL